MSRDNLAPSMFARIPPRFVTPVNAIVLTGAAMALTIATLDVMQIAKMASAFMILVFSTINICVVVLRETGIRWYKPSFRSPAYPFVQVAGVLGGLAILAMMGWLAVLSVAAVIALGSLFYLVYGRRKVTKRHGALQQMGPRRDLLDTLRRHPSGIFQSVASGVDVIVPLYDRSPPEPLVELAAALGAGGRVGVVQVTEVPAQLDVDALDETKPEDVALERRAHAMAVQIGVPMDWEQVICRDLRKQTYEMVLDKEPSWVLFEWQIQRRNAVLVRNPFAWLYNHLPCNVAVFKDAGIRVLKRVLVVAEASPHDDLVARTADRIADLANGQITFARYAPQGAGPDHSKAVRSYHQALAARCRSKTRLVEVVGHRRLDAMVELTARHDLLLIAEPPFSRWSSLRTKTWEDELTNGALCSVLRIRVPQHAEVGGAGGAPPPGSPPGEKLLPQVLDDDLVVVGADVPRKRILFERLADKFAAVHGGSATDLAAALWYREQQQNSAISDGVALAFATAVGVAAPRLGVITLLDGVDYHHAEGQRVDVVLWLISSAPDHHAYEELRETLGHLLATTDVANRLRAAGSSSEVREALVASIDTAWRGDAVRDGVHPSPSDDS